MSGVLSEKEFEFEVFHATESVRTRGVLLTHDLFQRRELDSLRRQVERLQAALAPAPDPTNERHRIASWIRSTNAADTVRAKYARKLADYIDADDLAGLEG